MYHGNEGMFVLPVSC